MNYLQDIEIRDRNPIYKQLVEHIESSVMKGLLKPGDPLPSISQYARRLDISKETVKKAYGILTRRGLLESHQGKGFFVRAKSRKNNLKIIILSDKLSPYRQTFLNSFSQAMGHSAEIHILLHNQDVEILRYYLDQSLGKFDYFIITPHFPRDPETGDKVIKQLSRIPDNQLILADKNVDDYSGNCGAAYQDFSYDVATALSTVTEELRRFPCIDVFNMPNSMYGYDVELAIARFCDRNNLHASFHGGISGKDIHGNQLCIFLNSQADDALFTINEIAKAKGLVIGRDIKLISYNESPLCSILFGGLSTISTDFAQMGRLCAEMIKTGEMKKIKCDIQFNKRHTF